MSEILNGFVVSTKLYFKYLYKPLLSTTEFYENEVKNEPPENIKFLSIFIGSVVVVTYFSIFLGNVELRQSYDSWSLFGVKIVQVPVLGDLVIALFFGFGIMMISSIIAVIECLGFILLQYKNFPLKNYIYFRILQIPGAIVVTMAAVLFLVLVMKLIYFLGFDNFSPFWLSTPVLLAIWFVPPWRVIRKTCNSSVHFLTLLCGYSLLIFVSSASP